MNEYIPTTEEVRDRYFSGSGRLLPSLGEFYRWLAAHDADVISEYRTSNRSDGVSARMSPVQWRRKQRRNEKP